MSRIRLVHGDCLSVLKKIPDNSVDSVVTDPPYAYEGGLKAHQWDNFKSPQEFMRFCRAWGREAFRVLKPGGYVVSFCGNKTYHWMAVALELSGFTTRNMISWIYGQSMNKGYDLAQSIEKLLTSGAARRADRNLGVGRRQDFSFNFDKSTRNTGGKIPLTTPEAQKWEGWNTDIKTMQEPIYLGQKPLSEKNFAANVLRHGVGGVNIDPCRISEQRRFPGNVIHDGSPAVLSRFSELDTAKRKDGAAQFFYCAKPNQKERKSVGNVHPTIKPTDLMRYLTRLVTPKNGLVLDPFTGSGTTAVACVLEGFRFIGIEKEKPYLQIASRRLKLALER